MMYYLNKIVGAFTSPLIIALLLMIVGVIFVLRGKKRPGGFLIFGTFAWIWLWSMPVMRLLVGVPLESGFLVDGRVPEVDVFTDKADAIVLLGGGMGRNEDLSPYGEMSANADRVWQAARLWNAGKAPKIISTGIDPEKSTLGLLKDFGVKEDSVLFLDARNTEEEAKIIAKTLKASDQRPTILLVTSAWHMMRAKYTFEKYAPDLKVVCAPADFEYSMGKYRELEVTDFLPDAFALFRNSIALHEWIGFVGYKIFR